MADTRPTDTATPAFQLRLHDRRSIAAPAHDCVIALKALGEESRVRIVGLLVGKALDVGEIAERLGISQYNVSKHLRILREAGLVEVEKVGRQHRYALPNAMRGRGSDANVLNLGCCSFQFRDDAGNGSPRGSTTPKEPRHRSARRSGTTKPRR